MGDARRRKLLGGPEVRPKPVRAETIDEYNSPGSNLPPRTPAEIEAALAAEDHAHAIIAASIDFIFRTGEDALRQQTRRFLRSGKG